MGQLAIHCMQHAQHPALACQLTQAQQAAVFQHLDTSTRDLQEEKVLRGK